MCSGDAVRSVVGGFLRDLPNIPCPGHGSSRLSFSEVKGKRFTKMFLEGYRHPDHRLRLGRANHQPQRSPHRELVGRIPTER